MAIYNLACFNLIVSPTELSSRIPWYCCKTPTPNGGKHHENGIKGRTKTLASKSGGSFSLGSVLKRCETCAGQGAIECSGCKGTGRNKKNGNIFERWKCFDCQGFGMKSCPSCGKGGLTPEQRGER